MIIRISSLAEIINHILTVSSERDASLSLLNDEKQQLQQHCSQWQNEVERLKMSSAELRRRLEDSQAALHELGRENQSLQVLILFHYAFLKSEKSVLSVD